MPLDEPLLIIEPQSVMEGAAEILDGLERAHPQQLLLERPNEPLRTPMAFWGTHERRTRRHPEKPEFCLEGLAHILTAVIMPHLHTRCMASREYAELLARPLADGFQCLKTGGPGRSMNSHTFERAMIDGHEDGHRAMLHCDGAGGIGAPHLIRTLRRDRAVVDPWPHDTRRPAGSHEVNLPHEPQHPQFGRANPLRPQTRPYFAMPFPEKRRGGQHLPNVPGEHLVGVRCLRASRGWGAVRLRACW